MKETGIINYGKLEKAIIHIEHFFEEIAATYEEKQLIINQINARLIRNAQQSRTNDLVHGFGGGILGKMLGNIGEDGNRK